MRVQGSTDRQISLTGIFGAGGGGQACLPRSAFGIQFIFYLIFRLVGDPIKTHTKIISRTRVQLGFRKRSYIIFHRTYSDLYEHTSRVSEAFTCAGT